MKALRARRAPPQARALTIATAPNRVSASRASAGVAPVGMAPTVRGLQMACALTAATAMVSARSPVRTVTATRDGLGRRANRVLSARNGRTERVPEMASASTDGAIAAKDTKTSWTAGHQTRVRAMSLGNSAQVMVSVLKERAIVPKGSGGQHALGDRSAKTSAHATASATMASASVILASRAATARSR